MLLGQPVAEHALIALRKSFNAPGETGFLRGLAHQSFILDPGDIAHANILLDAQVIAREILEDSAHMPTKFARIKLTNIDPIPENAPFCWIIETHQELDERGLASSVESHKCETSGSRDE